MIRSIIRRFQRHRNKIKLTGLHQFTAYYGDIVRDSDGNILNEVAYVSPVYRNVITTVGKNLMLDRLFGLGSDAALGHIGVGNGTAAAADSQTQLLGGSVLLKAADAGTSRTSNVVTIQATFGTSEANFVWEEAGIFNGTVNGTSRMYNRVKVGPFTKSSVVSMVYRTTITQS